MSENVIKRNKRDPKLWLLLIGAAVGVFLLCYGGIRSEQKEKEAADAAALSASALDPDDYAEQVEKQVEKICGQVRGAGAVDAVVTLKGGYRAVYATDSQSSASGYKNNMVLVGSGSSEGAVLICYENPELSGIGIVCAGGNDPVVRERILSLVCATFNIPSNKVYVAAR